MISRCVPVLNLKRAAHCFHVDASIAWRDFFETPLDFGILFRSLTDNGLAFIFEIGSRCAAQKKRQQSFRNKLERRSEKINIGCALFSYVNTAKEQTSCEEKFKQKLARNERGRLECNTKVFHFLDFWKILKKIYVLFLLSWFDVGRVRE
jgi:hypothetical protein